METLTDYKSAVISVQLPFKCNWELESTVRINLTVLFTKY